MKDLSEAFRNPALFCNIASSGYYGSLQLANIQRRMNVILVSPPKSSQ